MDEDLGDVRIGELEGKSLDANRDAPAHWNRKERFPGGESLDEAALRYASVFGRLLARADRDARRLPRDPVRYLANAAGGSGELNGPLKFVANATPYLFDETSRAAPSSASVSSRGSVRVITVADTLALLDWKRRVFSLYAAVRALEPAAGSGCGGDPGRAVSPHPQSPLAADRGCRLRRPRVLALRRAGSRPRRPRGRRGCAGRRSRRAGLNRCCSSRSLARASSCEGSGSRSRCRGWRPTAAAPSSASATRRAARESYGGGRYLLDTVKGADLGEDDGGSSSTSTSPTTRPAPTTRAGPARWPRRRTAGRRRGGRGERRRTSEPEALRSDISELDRRLLELLNRRLELVASVRDCEDRPASAGSTRSARRTSCRRSWRANPGPLSERGVTSIFSAVLDVLNRRSRPTGAHRRRPGSWPSGNAPSSASPSSAPVSSYFDRAAAGRAGTRCRGSDADPGVPGGRRHAAVSSPRRRSPRPSRPRSRRRRRSGRCGSSRCARGARRSRPGRGDHRRRLDQRPLASLEDPRFVRAIPSPAARPAARRAQRPTSSTRRRGS